MISQGLKMLKRAIDERPKGGMQTGMPKIQLREADAARAVAELEWAQQRIAELEAQAPKWVSVKDCLPDYGVPVLLKINGVVQHITYMRDGSDDSKDWFEPLFYNDHENAFFIDFEADVEWMPLPKENESE